MKQLGRLLLALCVLVSCACSSSSGNKSNQPPAAPTPVATPVGSPNGAAASATIGAAGGSLSSADGVLTLTVPAGALAVDTQIGIEPITNTAHGGHGNAYRLTPDGQTFQSPVTFTFAYNDQDLVGTAPEALGVAYQTADGFWHWVNGPVLDTANKTVSVSTDHFTDYAYVSGFNLRPGAASVGVGGKVQLSVNVCYVAAIDDTSELAPLPGLDCSAAGDPTSLEVLAAISEWAVNGVPGGTGSTGTVSKNGVGATYTAPATVPKPNVVSVSARVNNTKYGTMLLVSTITVTGDAFARYDGTITVDGSVVNGVETTEVHAIATVSFTLQSSTSSAIAYDLAPSSKVIIDPAKITDVGTSTSVCTNLAPITGQFLPGFMFSIAPKAGKYGLSGAIAGSDQFSCDPGDGTGAHDQQKAVGASIVTTDGSGGMVPFTDLQHLTGQCQYPAGVTITWDLVGSN